MSPSDELWESTDVPTKNDSALRNDFLRNPLPCCMCTIRYTSSKASISVAGLNATTCHDGMRGNYSGSPKRAVDHGSWAPLTAHFGRSLSQRLDSWPHDSYLASSECNGDGQYSPAEGNPGCLAPITPLLGSWKISIGNHRVFFPSPGLQGACSTRDQYSNSVYLVPSNQQATKFCRQSYTEAFPFQSGMLLWP